MTILWRRSSATSRPSLIMRRSGCWRRRWRLWRTSKHRAAARARRARRVTVPLKGQRRWPRAGRRRESMKVPFRAARARPRRRRRMRAYVEVPAKRVKEGARPAGENGRLPRGGPHGDHVLFVLTLSRPSFLLSTIGRAFSRIHDEYDSVSPLSRGYRWRPQPPSSAWPVDCR